MVSYHGGRGVGGFSWKRLCLCGQLVTRKGLKQALCCIEDIYILKFLILDSCFAYECIKVVFTMKYNTYYRRFNATIKTSTEVNYFDLLHV